MAPAYTIDANLWGRSVSGGRLDDLWVEPPDDIYTLTRAARDCPEPQITAEGVDRILGTFFGFERFDPETLHQVPGVLFGQINQPAPHASLGELPLGFTEKRLQTLRVRGSERKQELRASCG